MFNCEQCGACCRNVGKTELGKQLALPNGICKYLNQKTNLCTIYKDRPIFCNIDEYYKKYLYKIISLDMFYKLNKQQCKQIQNLNKDLERIFYDCKFK